MKNSIIIALALISTLGIGCGSAKGDDPGSSYMPDMYYSRAYETYGYNNVEGELDSLSRRGIRYSGMPVPGTVARGDNLNYYLTADSSGLTAARGLKNPVDSLTASPAQMKEAERLYLVNCGVCHGSKLDGNGPLYNGGNGAYPVAPRNLVDDYTKALTDGHMFHVITYGIRTMGSYASQLNPDQRWWVVKYIRNKQGGGGAAKDSTAAGTAQGASADTARTQR